MKNDFAKNFLEIFKKLFCQKILKNSNYFAKKIVKNYFTKKVFEKLKKMILQKIL